MSFKGSGLVASLSLTASITLASTTTFADQCAPIIKAMQTSLRAPAYRQLLTTKGKPERVAAVAIGDTVYLELGTGAKAQKMSRQEIQSLAEEEFKNTTFNACTTGGTETLNGVSTTVYEYSYKTKDGDGGRSKLWVDGDSHIRQQEIDGGTMRYEYDNVTAPE